MMTKKQPKKPPKPRGKEPARGEAARKGLADKAKRAESLLAAEARGAMNATLFGLMSGAGKSIMDSWSLRSASTELAEMRLRVRAADALAKAVRDLAAESGGVAAALGPALAAYDLTAPKTTPEPTIADAIGAAEVPK